MLSRMAMCYSVQYNVVAVTVFYPRRECLVSYIPAMNREVKERDVVRRRALLRRVDNELAKNNHKAALSIVKQLQRRRGGLRGFGAAKQVPRGISSFNELELNETKRVSLQSIQDSMLDSIKQNIELSFSKELSLLGPDNLKRDESCYPSKDHLRCTQHEAGHFLVGYLLGLLPNRYRVPGVNDKSIKPHKQLSPGMVQFLGFEFLEEVDTTNIPKEKIRKGKPPDNRLNGGNISSKTLNRFLCVILGGVAAEHLVFGHAEGLRSDVEKLDSVLKWLGYTEDEANSKIRWAAVNTISILYRHGEARSKLADSMGLGKSIGSCIETIENTFTDKEI